MSWKAHGNRRDSSWMSGPRDVMQKSATRSSNGARSGETIGVLMGTDARHEGRVHVVGGTYMWKRTKSPFSGVFSRS